VASGLNILKACTRRIKPAIRELAIPSWPLIRTVLPEGETFKKDMDRYIKSIKESAKAKNATEILMPGEPECRTETKRLKEGIPLVPVTVKELVALGEGFGISLPFMDRAL
jgi:hypothetical protein